MTNEAQKPPSQILERVGKPFIVGFVISFVVMVDDYGQHDQAGTNKGCIYYPCWHPTEENKKINRTANRVAA